MHASNTQRCIQHGTGHGGWHDPVPQVGQHSRGANTHWRLDEAMFPPAGKCRKRESYGTKGEDTDAHSIPGPVSWATWFLCECMGSMVGGEAGWPAPRDGSLFAAFIIKAMEIPPKTGNTPFCCRAHNTLEGAGGSLLQDY